MAESGHHDVIARQEAAAAGAGAGGLDGLAALVERAGEGRGGRGLPPVEKWQPERVFDMDMEIRRDGSWFHEGREITRRELVRLFSTVLRKDGDGHTYLVTPVEKARIRVEDAPFLAVEMHAGERGGEPILTFRTNMGDVVEAGAGHPLRFETDPHNGGVKPYLLVRGRLEALLTRAVTMELMELVEEVPVDGEPVDGERGGGVPVMMVSSGGEDFTIAPGGAADTQTAR